MSHVRSEQLQLTGSAIRYQEEQPGRTPVTRRGRGRGSNTRMGVMFRVRSGWEMLHYSGSGLNRCESYLTNLP